MAGKQRKFPKGTAARKRFLSERWTQIMSDYRRRHREWIMKYMPNMPPDEWKEYEKWVAGFGAVNLGTSSRHARKVKRHMRSLRQRIDAGELLNAKFLAAALNQADRPPRSVRRTPFESFAMSRQMAESFKLPRPVTNPRTTLRGRVRT